MNFVIKILKMALKEKKQMSFKKATTVLLYIYCKCVLPVSCHDGAEEREAKHCGEDVATLPEVPESQRGPVVGRRAKRPEMHSDLSPLPGHQSLIRATVCLDQVTQVKVLKRIGGL